MSDSTSAGERYHRSHEAANEGLRDRFERGAPRLGLPPGPRWPALAQTVSAIFATERLTGYCRKRYGSMATLRILGLGRAVAVWDPRLVATIFKDWDVWRGGQGNALLFGATAGPSSVFVLDGDAHLVARRLLLSSLRDEAIRNRTRAVAELAEAEVERWPIGRKFPLHPSMQAITLEVMLRAVIGIRDRKRIERLRIVLKRIAAAHPFIFRGQSAGPLAPLSSRLPWISAAREADRLLYDEIAERRQAGSGRDDVLSLLIAAGESSGRPLSDAQLRDHVAGLVVAGHETTAATLAWCFERLVHHPACLQRLQTEILDGAGEAYLDAVINETLRTRPVIDASLRKLHADARLGDHILPAGTLVGVLIRETARSSTFADPDRFRPERFLDGATLPPYAYVPFGGGVHRCLGASLAIAEIQTIIRAVLERVRLKAPAGGPERSVRWRRVPMSPAAGARVVVTERVRATPRRQSAP